MTTEQIRFAWVSSCGFLSLNRRRVVPLYTQVYDRPVYRVPRPAHTSVRLGLPFPNLQHKFIQS
jgi:hypothetical protein